MTDRAQTIQDYLLGITLLLITLTAVFGYFPGIFQPFEDPITNEEEAMAENLGDRLVTLNQTTGSERTVNFTDFNNTLSNEDSYESVLRDAGVPQWKNTNITVTRVTSSGQVREFAAGDRRQDQPEATRLRLIRAQDPDHPCYNGCQLIIRVW